MLNVPFFKFALLSELAERVFKEASIAPSANLAALHKALCYEQMGQVQQALALYHQVDHLIAKERVIALSKLNIQAPLYIPFNPVATVNSGVLSQNSTNRSKSPKVCKKYNVIEENALKVLNWINKSNILRINPSFNRIFSKTKFPKPVLENIIEHLLKEKFIKIYLVNIHRRFEVTEAGQEELRKNLSP